MKKLFKEFYKGINKGSFLYSKLLKISISLIMLFCLTSCKKEKKIIDGSYVFKILESDSNNSDISDNLVVRSYNIEYYQCASVTNSLNKIDDKYYLNSTDYLILNEGPYGLYLVSGYIDGYNNNQLVDLSWSKTTINNGQEIYSGIGETPVEGLTSFEIIIDGWK